MVNLNATCSGYISDEQATDTEIHMRNIVCLLHSKSTDGCNWCS